MHSSPGIELAAPLGWDDRATPEPRLVAVGPVTYLATAARGEPRSERFRRALDVLAAVRGELRRLRAQDGEPFPLERFGALSATGSRRSAGRATSWRVLLRVPDEVLPEEVQRAARVAVPDRVTLERLEEGLCVQALATGGEDEQQRVAVELARAARLEGLAFRGPLHLVYLTDPRRNAAIGAGAVILRQRVRPARLDAPERRPPARFEGQPGAA